MSDIIDVRQYKTNDIYYPYALELDWDSSVDVQDIKHILNSRIVADYNIDHYKHLRMTDLHFSNESEYAMAYLALA